LRRLQANQPHNEPLRINLAYLEKRQAHMVESANKNVVEARFKGAGMHWQRTHIDPLLALRSIVCSDRWDEAWPQIETRLRTQAY
jgi:hypothetical protein